MFKSQLLLFALFVLLPLSNCDDLFNTPMEVRRYFPEVDNDMTKITWYHRCNSRSMLESALNSGVMMLEADVVLGRMDGVLGGPPLPVMAHPPDSTSDLSLERFLDMILQRRKRKGIKLDFKSVSAFRASENVLEQFLARAEVDFPVWVNADIVRGPGHPSQKEVVDPYYFLRTCVNKFPIATISAGWTVDASSAEILHYNSSHIDEMTALLAEHHVVHPVTFPVHAGIAANSIHTLASLVHSSVDGTSLTLWASAGDWVNYDKLRQLISTVGKDKVFVDMPEDMKFSLFTAPQESAASHSRLGVAAFSVALTTFLLVF